MSASRERLLSALPRTQPYTLVGEHSLKGETVVLKALSGDAYIQWLTATDPLESRSILLVNGIAEPAMTPADADAILALEAPVIVELSNAIAMFAGIAPGRGTAAPDADAEEATAEPDAAPFPKAGKR